MRVHGGCRRPLDGVPAMPQGGNLTPSSGRPLASRGSRGHRPGTPPETGQRRVGPGRALTLVRAGTRAAPGAHRERGPVIVHDCILAGGAHAAVVGPADKTRSQLKAAAAGSSTRLRRVLQAASAITRLPVQSRLAPALSTRPRNGCLHCRAGRPGYGHWARGDPPRTNPVRALATNITPLSRRRFRR